MLLFVLMGLGIGIKLLVQRDPLQQNVWLKVFAPAAQAFAAGQDMYSEQSGFRYPPLAAALMVPFTWLGPIGGSIVWRWTLLLGLGLAVRAAMRAGFPFALTSRERGVFWLLLTPAVIGSANIGQPNTLILGLMIWATVGACCGKAGGPGLAVLGNTMLKIYPFAHGMVLAALRPRLLPWLLAGLVTIVAVPFLLQRPAFVVAQYDALYQLLRAEDRTLDLGRAYRDLRLLAAAIGLPIGDGIFRMLQLVLGAGLALGCLWLQRRRVAPARVFEHALALSTCWCLLLGPATERVTYALLGPCIAWPLLHCWRRGGLRASAGWALVNALYLADHLVPTMPRDYQAAHPWVRCALPMTTLLATALLVARAVRDGRAGPETAMECAPVSS